MVCLFKFEEAAKKRKSLSAIDNDEGGYFILLMN